jgi:ABC-type polysaccharide/polyol phosphate export permease
MVSRTITVLKANMIRNLRIDWKYKLNFITDLAWLAVDVITFLFLGQVVASSDIDNFLYEGFLKEFLVVGVIYWVIFTRAFKDGVSVIPNEATLGALGFIITNDITLSDLIAGQFSSSTIKTSVTLVIFVLPIVFILSFVPFGETTILHPLIISPEIILFAFLIIIISWIFMLGITILASTLNVIFKKSGPLTFLLSYLLTMLSGYFFPLEVLRTFGLSALEEILYFIPTTGMLYSLRSMLIIGQVPPNITLIIIINGFIAVLLLFLAIYIMRKITRKAAYSGTLEFY